MAAYEALKNPLAPRASGKSIVVAWTGPTASKRRAGQRAHSQCQGLMGMQKQLDKENSQHKVSVENENETPKWRTWNLGLDSWQYI